MLENLKAYPAFDSLGGPALAIKATTEGGSYSSSVPVGGLDRLLRIFSSIRPNFIGLDENDWQGLDAFLQELIPGEKPLSLSISLAIARAGSGNDLWKLGSGRTFPFPLARVLSNREWQEFFIIPWRAKNPRQAAKTCLEVHNTVLEELRKENLLEGMTPQGSWFCGLDLLKALEFLSSLAGDWELKIGADFHASGLWNGKTTYNIGQKNLNPEGYLDFMEEITHTYRIYYLEDPFHKGDFASFSRLLERMKKKLVAGKELYPDRETLKKGIGLKSGNGAVIDPLLAGTLLETLNLSSLARKGGLSPIISQNPGGETGDSCLADISLLSGAPLLKTGLSSGGLTRINRLMELWEEVPEARMAELP